MCRARELRAHRGAEAALLIVMRHSNCEIGDELCISEHTARHPVQKVMQKPGVGSRRLARQKMLSD
jgi:DNA-binding CsgD family transcriptional regulator